MRSPTLRSPSSPLGLGAVVLAALAAAGCSSSAGTAPIDTTAQPVTYAAGPFTVKAGSELVMCTFVQGDNAQEEDIAAFTTEQDTGGHHVIVYTVDHRIDLPPTVCSQGGQPGWNQVFGSQIAHDKLAYPAGVGFHIQAHQQFVIETHYINATANDLQAGSSFGLSYAAPGSVKERAALYFFGTLDINIPPNGSLTKDVTCSPPEPMTLYSMAGHMHRRGTKLTVDHGSGPTFYEDDNWDLPPAKQFEAGMALGTSDKLHVTCNWKNDGPNHLQYPDEMCFAIGMYWPAKGALFCASGGGRDACLCQTQGGVEAGPGGATVKVNVARAAKVAGLVGDITAGSAIYCALYPAADWSGFMPKPGAQPHYLRSAEHAQLTSASTQTTLEIDDVSPGDYRVSCFMDTIGGGFIPGKGDPVNLTAPSITVAAGKTATAAVMLDFAIP